MSIPSRPIMSLIAAVGAGVYVFNKIDAPHYDNLDYGIPGECNQIVNRQGYALGYVEDWEQPAWVVYRLTAEEVATRAAARSNAFRADREIKTGSATPTDYLRSGYDKGHLAPANDMNWSTVAMAESFLMSNMSPQKPAFNRGIWKQIETFARHSAESEKSVFIATGPIFYQNVLTNRIGANAVAVPHAFYKVILDESPPSKMLAFIVPNEGTNATIEEFVRTTEEVENQTGLSFFPTFADVGIECLKTNSDIRVWIHQKTMGRLFTFR